MHRRYIASLAAIAVSALVVGVGCSEEQKPQAAGGSTGTAKTTAKAPASAAPTATATATAAAAAPAGNGTIKGVVNFTGTAPEMKVPAKRKDAEFCKTKEVKYNAVTVNGGKLKDVFVRIENGAVKGKFDVPKDPAVIDQVDCMYTPRIQGALAGQQIAIKNSDGTLHNVHTYKGVESWFNQAQPKGAEAISKDLEDPTIVKFKCDVHPWMTGFVVITDHPFFAVSGDDGSFTINKVPAGKYKVEAWHSQFGLKSTEVEIADGKTADISFSYDGKEAEPAENKEELKGLF